MATVNYVPGVAACCPMVSGEWAPCCDAAPPASALPSGWRAVPSRSTPGKTVYRNKWTGARIDFLKVDTQGTALDILRSAGAHSS